MSLLVAAGTAAFLRKNEPTARYEDIVSNAVGDMVITSNGMSALISLLRLPNDQINETVVQEAKARDNSQHKTDAFGKYQPVCCASPVLNASSSGSVTKSLPKDKVGVAWLQEHVADETIANQDSKKKLVFDDCACLTINSFPED